MANYTVGESRAHYALKSNIGSASLPAGSYEIDAPSDWILKDNDGTEHEIPSGTSDHIFPAKITEVVRANAEEPTKWTKGIVQPNNLAQDTTFTITVSDGNFLIDGESATSVRLYQGATYTFDQSDASNASDKLYLSLTPDGHHPTAGAVADFEFTNGISYTGTEGSDGKLVFSVDGYFPKKLYLVSASNSGLGDGSEALVTNFNDSLLPSTSDITTDGTYFYIATEGQRFARSTDGQSWEIIANFDTSADQNSAPRIKWTQYDTARFENDSISFINEIKPGDLLLVYSVGYSSGNYLYQPLDGWTREIDYGNSSIDYGIVLDYRIADGTEQTYGPLNMRNNDNRLGMFIMAIENYRIDSDGKPVFTHDWRHEPSTPYDVDTLQNIEGGSLVIAGWAGRDGSITDENYSIPDGYTDLGYRDMTWGIAGAAYKYREFTADPGDEPGTGGFLGINDDSDDFATIHLAFPVPEPKESSSAIAFGDSKLCSFDKFTGKIGTIDLTKPVKVDYSNFNVTIDDSANVEFIGHVTYQWDSSNTTTRESLPGGVSEGDLIVITTASWGNIIDQHLLDDGYEEKYEGSYSSAELRVYTKIATKNETTYLVPAISSTSNPVNVSVMVYRNARTVTINLEAEGNQNIVPFAPREVPKGSYQTIIGSMEGLNIGVSLAPENYTELVRQSRDDSNDITQMIFQREIPSATTEDPTTLTISTTTDLHFISMTVNPAVALEVSDLSYQNNKFYAVGQTYATSTDGLTWTAFAKPIVGDIVKALHVNGKLYIVSDSGQIASTSDESTWTIHESANTNPIVNLFYENDTLVAVTNDGSTINSRDGIYWDYQPLVGLGITLSDGNSDQVEVVDMRAYDGDENRGRFIGTYRIPETAQVGDVVFFNMSWDLDNHMFEVVFEGDSRWQKMYDHRQDIDLGDRGLDMVSYAIRIEEDTDYNVHAGAYITYQSGSGNDIQSIATDSGRVISFQVLRNVGDINDIEVFGRTSTNHVYPARAHRFTGTRPDFIEGAHTQLVVNHINEAYGNPAVNIDADTWNGYENLYFNNEFESGRGSMVAATKYFPEGGIGEDEYWRDSGNNSINSDCHGHGLVFVLRTPVLAADSGSSTEEVTDAGTAELYPYFLKGYSNGVTTVQNTLTGVQTSIQEIPYFAEGLGSIMNAGNRVVGVTTSGLILNAGKPYEVITLKPNGGLDFAN